MSITVEEMSKEWEEARKKATGFTGSLLDTIASADSVNLQSLYTVYPVPCEWFVANSQGKTWVDWLESIKPKLGIKGLPVSNGYLIVETTHKGVEVPEELVEVALLWKNRIDEYYTANGDIGSCVLGAGFEFTYKDTKWKLCPIGRVQGSIVWESSVDEIESKLKELGVEGLHYDWGRMD